ncbi:zinc-binding dehydrogenase [bacterium]|nr:zinc-binding dehydrogenase [bacterium]
MKAWIYAPGEPGSLRLDDIPVPAITADQVLVRIRGASVCGTDEQMFRGQVAGVEPGIVPGHELFGEVVEMGREVNAILSQRGLWEVKKGALVAAESHYHVPGCGDDEGIIGIWGPRDASGRRLLPLSGAYAEYTAVPAECLYPLPEVLVDGFYPSLLEAAGNDALIGRYLKDKGAKSVAIVGCGPHGLYAQIFARHFGVEKIAAFEVDPVRIEFAQKLGIADAVWNSRDAELDAKVMEFTHGAGFDAVVDIAGKYKSVLEMCKKYTRDGGHLVLFGLYGDPAITLAGRKPDDIIFSRQEFTHSENGKKLRVTGITGRTHAIWTYLIEALARDAAFRRQVMSPATHLGALDNLGPDTIKRDPKVLKRAYAPFK